MSDRRTESVDRSEAVTPVELSRELGVSAKRIRDWLRKEYGTLHGGDTRWYLQADRADLVRAEFRRRG